MVGRPWKKEAWHKRAYDWCAEQLSVGYTVTELNVNTHEETVMGYPRKLEWAQQEKARCLRRRKPGCTYSIRRGRDREALKALNARFKLEEQERRR